MKSISAVIVLFFTTALIICAEQPAANKPPTRAAATVETSSLQGKILCGYQGWFRCPGDPSNLGWIHWSRDSKKISPGTLTFEMWPDLREFTEAERFPAPGFTHADGSAASLFSSDNAATVQRHFEWMRDHGIDGVWLQQFVVDLPGGPAQKRYESRLRVLQHVRAAAQKTGRAWALCYDISGMPAQTLFEVLTADWKKMVDEKIAGDSRYLQQNGRPVVQIWGFYRNEPNNAMTADLGNRLIEFFNSPGRYSAFLVGGGDWNWRKNPDPTWQAMLQRLPGYVPWNVGNYSQNTAGLKRASTNTWVEDKRECNRRGQLWIPTVYPGFSWDNLKRQKPGSSLIPRRGGQFLWEQFHELAKLRADSVSVAMFDEVDEGTAIFKVTSSPPTQAYFVGYEDLPSNWYLRLVGEGAKMLRGERPITAEIPIQP